jgi:short-subunit dehydrogenase
MPPFQPRAAIITGASSGLGMEFARQLAPGARRLMLVARREEPMRELGDTLTSAHPGLAVTVCAADLATDDGVAAVLAIARDRDFQPDCLINNAGLGDYGSFADADPCRLRAQLRVNVEALTILTHGLIPLLKTPAGILNVSSLAGNVPMPGLAVYAASKAAVTSLSEALAVELAPRGIRVSCLCPGPTPTSFGASARRPGGQDTDRSGQGLLRQPPEKVVAAALRALENGRPCVFPGGAVRVAGELFRCLPRFVLRRLLRLRRF